MVLVGTAGCTSADEPPPEEAAPSALPSRSVGSAPTLEAKPVPIRVTVARVAGERLPRRQADRLERRVADVLDGYFDAAYLGGEYPRRDFSRALAGFSAGAAGRAASDRDLLTNARIGPDTEAVVARTKQARLDLLVPGKHVAGLTARFRLVFLQQPVTGADQRVTVKGRLMMSRKKSGRWQIFGYDVTRSSVPAGSGGSR